MSGVREVLEVAEKAEALACQLLILKVAGADLPSTSLQLLGIQTARHLVLQERMQSARVYVPIMQCPMW